MLPPKLKLPPEQQQLLKLFGELSPEQQRCLLRYAEFLRQPMADEAATVPPAEPVPAEIARPPQESVIAGIRRLSATFHMLDSEALLHETSSLMTQHVMQGKPSEQVIDELEVVFRRHYERVKSPPE